MRLLISQETYDTLCRRLTQHHKGHKGLSEFPAIRSGLERNASIKPDGVEVDLSRLNIAADAIRDNIKFVGERYGAAPDKMILLDVEDAIADHERQACSPAPRKSDLTVAMTPDSMAETPVQQMQQTSEGKVFERHELGWFDQFGEYYPDDKQAKLHESTGRPDSVEDGIPVRYVWTRTSFGQWIEKPEPIA